LEWRQTAELLRTQLYSQVIIIMLYTIDSAIHFCATRKMYRSKNSFKSSLLILHHTIRGVTRRNQYKGLSIKHVRSQEGCTVQRHFVDKGVSSDADVRTFW